MARHTAQQLGITTISLYLVSMPISANRNQALGCLLGGAVGDAWGGHWEGMAGPIDFRIPEKSWVSDDTQFTLATCESIIACSAIDVEHLAAHFARKFKAGHFTGIGASTLKSMRELSAGVHWASAGSRGEFAAGNGAPCAWLLSHFF